MSLLERARNGESLAIDIIDMHGHIGRYGFTIPDLSVDSMVAYLDRLGIDSIFCSTMRCMTRYTEAGNADLNSAMRSFPGRIRGYISLYPDDAKKVEESVLRWLDHGFEGIKLHDSNGLPYSHSAYDPAYEIADERRLPVLLHTWGEERQISDVETLASRFPNISFLLAHAGSNQIQEYIRLADEFEHVYLELAFSQARRGLVEELVHKAGVHKVVWGSDCCFLNQAQQLGRVVGADLPDADKMRILGGNAREILKRVEK